MHRYTNSVFIYALVLVVGGLIGFFKVGSYPSLIAGSLFGLGLMWSGLEMKKGEPKGRYTALALAAILVIFFGMRFFGSYALFPAGVMLAYSAYMTYILQESE